VDEREELATQLRARDATSMLAELRGSLERAVQPTVVDLHTRRRPVGNQDPEPA
jgi:hypothetical protein